MVWIVRFLLIRKEEGGFVMRGVFSREYILDEYTCFLRPYLEKFGHTFFHPVLPLIYFVLDQGTGPHMELSVWLVMNKTAKDYRWEDVYINKCDED